MQRITLKMGDSVARFYIPNILDEMVEDNCVKK